jgi:hypothetical protein
MQFICYHAVWDVSGAFVILILMPTGAFQAHWNRPHCLTHLRRVLLDFFTLSYTSQTCFTGLHTDSSIPDAFYLPPLQLECLSSVILVLMPSRASQAQCTHPHHAVVVSHRHCTCLQTIWCVPDAFDCLYVVSRVLGPLGLPSCHLKHFRRVWCASGVSPMRLVGLCAT